MVRAVAIFVTLVLSGCVQAPPRNQPEPPLVTNFVAAEFELTREEGSRVTWRSSNRETKPFIDSGTPTEYSVSTYPGLTNDYIAISMRRLSGRAHSLTEPFDTRNLPRQSYLMKKCNLALGHPCEILERGKVVASVQRLK